MDEGLFRKHILQIQKAQDSKQDVCGFIQEKTGIILSSEEVIISKKKITIQTSSVKRSQLIQKKIQDIVKEKGYSVQL